MIALYNLLFSKEVKRRYEKISLRFTHIFTISDAFHLPIPMDPSYCLVFISFHPEGLPLLFLARHIY